MTNISTLSIKFMASHFFLLAIIKETFTSCVSIISKVQPIASLLQEETFRAYALTGVGGVIYENSDNESLSHKLTTPLNIDKHHIVFMTKNNVVTLEQNETNMLNLLHICRVIMLKDADIHNIQNVGKTLVIAPLYEFRYLIEHLVEEIGRTPFIYNPTIYLTTHNYVESTNKQ